jgi:flotillin
MSLGRANRKRSNMSGFIILIIVIVAAVLVILSAISALGQRYVKVGPNQALIIYGRGKYPDVITGGGKLVVPIFERAQSFSLELMSFDVAPQQNLYTNQGVSVLVEAVTQLKVRNDKDSILTAAEQFLSKTFDQRQALIRLVMEGHLRGIVGQLTIEQIVKEPEMVSEKMRSTSSADLTKMGLEVVSFTIKEVRDENEYIANMGRPEIERIRKEANIAAALAARDTQIQQANAAREAAVAKAAADQERVAAEAASEAKQSESQRDLALKRASYDAEVKKQQVIADKATDLQSQIVQQQIVAEAARAQEIDRTAQTKVQEAEGHRRQAELEATVVRAAEAEKQRVETQAQAEKQRISLEAEGRAAALRAQAEAEAAAARIRGAADAEAARLRGLAEADVIKAKGEAEAEAMRNKAAAYHEYNQAAVLDKVITNLPEVVRAIAEPLSKVDKISIVSTGSQSGGGNLGASRITGDVVNMLAQVPVLLEALTGTKVSDLMARVPGLAAAGEVSSTLNGTGGNSPGEKANDTTTAPEVAVKGSSGNTNDNTGTNPPDNTSPATSEPDAQKGTAPTSNVTSNAAPGSNRLPNQRHQMCR